ncbi:uncharacterized protein LOC128015298 isoform X2 [Carassius gibelio]|uniref:uncharacterized protein LOC128015298 isoform X2 n=1 Tax=Carassius gibelio TaxID=101364 RepID=UPI00227784BA|nr:uncharacterized protein LOC128015298 isoform X2 [Carassius gibelio]
MKPLQTMDDHSAPKPAPRLAPGPCKSVGNEKEEHHPLDPGLIQTGLECSSGDQPVTARVNEFEKRMVPPLPHPRTKPRSKSIPCCSESVENEKEECHPLDPGLIQTGLECFGGEQPVTVRVNEFEKRVVPPVPHPKTKPGSRSIPSCSESVGNEKEEHHPLDPGLIRTGLECSSGDQPVTARVNEFEKCVVPPLPHPKTKPRSKSIPCCSEKKVTFKAALEDQLSKRLQNSEPQVKESVRMGNTSRESTIVSDSDFRSFMHTGESFTNTLQVFVSHLPSCASALERQITELQEVANAVDKTHKGVKIAGITGGATGAVGGAAAVAGILLSPVTLGASLAITVVGVGVAAAGGVTGASAAITNKVRKDQVRKKVETILKECQSEMEEVEGYLDNISTEMGKLQEYDLLTLERVNVKSAKIVRLVGIAGGASTALSVMSRSSGVIHGFAVGMDLYFTGQDSEKLKKESKSRFAQQILEVAEQIQTGLTELMNMREKLLLEEI